MSMFFLQEKRFKKNFKKLRKGVKIAFVNRLSLFEEDKFNPQLKNHKLHGEYVDHRSIDITGDIRLIYRAVDELTIILVDIGPHSEFYE